MKILLAVSGGADSMYLACNAGNLFPGSEVAAAHCNFSLRGQESDGDESFVREWCASRGMPCLVRRFDTRAHAAASSLSTEMAARELRYSWFAQICREQGFDAVAVAHNASDNAETFLLNLLRGAGAKGLRGMKADSINEYGCRILRPMLDISREQITAYLTNCGQSWREDRTNAENEYRRNKLRNLVLPVFKDINPSFLQTLRQDMEHIAQVDDIAQDFFQQASERFAREDGAIIISALLKEKHWKYLLFRQLDGGIGSAELHDLIQALESGRQLSGKRFGPVFASKGLILFEKTPEDCGWKSELLDASSLTSFKVAEGTLFMDADKLGVLKIRPWQSGDWMHPLGLGGRKKVSDMFVDLGWDERRKQAAQVVEMKGSHIAALLFVRIDEAVKLDASSKNVLKISRS